MSSCARLSRSRSRGGSVLEGESSGAALVLGSRMGVFSVVAPAATDASCGQARFPSPLLGRAHL